MKRTLLLVPTLFFIVFAFAQTSKKAYPEKTKLKAVSFPGIKGKIFDDKTGAQLSARIVIADGNDSAYNPYYKSLPGFFTEEDGTFEDSLKPGNYTLTVFHGIDYESQKIPFTINADGGVNVEIYLKPWSELKEKGWVCGDGHDHLYTEKKPDTAMAKTLRKICLAQGIDFVCAAQGWEGYNDITWRDGYAKFSAEKFTLYYGSEMPKYRTGHTWWFGQNSTRNYFWNTMDTVYENNYFQSAHGTTWDFKTLNFPFIPDEEVVQRFKSADHSVAIMAHPTSWWLQKRGNGEKYVTNAAANLSFGLLSGKIWDGIVVMGYNHDHYFYQNLWFHVLNEGYRMPAISELDVMKVCEKKLFPDFGNAQHDVAITSPFYFWANGVNDPQPLISKIDLTVTAPQNNPAFKNVTVDVLANGKKINTLHLKNGAGSFTMPVSDLLKISAEGYTPIYRTLYLDYPPQQELIEELATGNWQKKYDSTTKFNSGEIPWEEFHFEKTRQILSQVNWKIGLRMKETAFGKNLKGCLSKCFF